MVKERGIHELGGKFGRLRRKEYDWTFRSNDAGVVVEANSGMLTEEFGIWRYGSCIGDAATNTGAEAWIGATVKRCLYVKN
jgi:hypothetical protein